MQADGGASLAPSTSLRPSALSAAFTVRGKDHDSGEEGGCGTAEDSSTKGRDDTLRANEGTAGHMGGEGEDDDEKERAEASEYVEEAGEGVELPHSERGDDEAEGRQQAGSE